ncbi:hypothetical protein CEXT_398331 [Caerostris extrusa]|uniref:Uncharacterized protein n=1 Tax=Caerostris extrusa TaxID=172846 RepID=A0AAV4XWX3_CAEEX|nr:hypothetical protein CEXT_398331 [Caerostris extrusa]
MPYNPVVSEVGYAYQKVASGELNIIKASTLKYALTKTYGKKSAMRLKGRWIYFEKQGNHYEINEYARCPLGFAVNSFKTVNIEIHLFDQTTDAQNDALGRYLDIALR